MNKKLSESLSRAAVLFGVVGLCTCTTPPMPIIPAKPPVVAFSPFFSPKVFSSLALYIDDRTHTLHPGELHSIEDEFMRSALQKGYVLAARSDIERVVEEAGLQQTGVTEFAMANSARALGVSAIILVSIDEVGTTSTNFQTEAAISARLIDTELGQIVWMSTYSADVEGPAAPHSTGVVGVSQVIAGTLPSRDVRPQQSVPSVPSPDARVTVAPDFDSKVLSRLAVYIENRSRDEWSDAGAMHELENAFMATAINRGYALAARSDLPQIQTEIEFQNSGAVDLALARKGRALGVPAVLTVSVDRVSLTRDARPYLQQLRHGSILVSARIITTDRARVVWISSTESVGDIWEPADIAKLVTIAAWHAASGLPSRAERSQ